MESFWLILLLQGIVFGGFCSFIAGEKNRDPFGWFFLGFLFSLIAVLALIAVPKLEGKGNDRSDNLEAKISETDTKMHEAGQPIIDAIRKILLGGENKE